MDSAIVGGHTLDTGLIIEMHKHHVFSLHPHYQTKENRREEKTHLLFLFGWVAFFGIFVTSPAYMIWPLTTQRKKEKIIIIIIIIIELISSFSFSFFLGGEACGAGR